MTEHQKMTYKEAARRSGRGFRLEPNADTRFVKSVCREWLVGCAPWREERYDENTSPKTNARKFMTWYGFISGHPETLR